MKKLEDEKPLKKIYHGRKTKIFKKPESDLPVISLPFTDMESAKEIARQKEYGHPKIKE